MIAFAFNILKQHALKPKEGEPCNNCGLCCRVSVCEVSKTLLHSEQTPCIALEFREGKYVCGMLLRPAHYLGADYAGEHREYIDYWVHPGYGCEMSDEVVAVKL
jgi:hypothetical protein